MPVATGTKLASTPKPTIKTIFDYDKIKRAYPSVVVNEADLKSGSEARRFPRLHITNIAALIGVQATHVCYILAGKRRGSVEVLGRMAKILKVDLNTLSYLYIDPQKNVDRLTGKHINAKPLSLKQKHKK